MSQFDLKKLSTAITYVDRMSSGNNPRSNKPDLNSNILTDMNVRRCMQFCKEVLQQVHDNGGYVGSLPPMSQREFIPVSQFVSSFRYREDQGISRFLAQVYEPAGSKPIRKLTNVSVTNWLRSNGYLRDIPADTKNGKSTIPTEKGKAIGITSSEKTNYKGESYISITYNQQAQEFLLTKLAVIENAIRQN